MLVRLMLLLLSGTLGTIAAVMVNIVRVDLAVVCPVLCLWSGCLRFLYVCARSAVLSGYCNGLPGMLLPVTTLLLTWLPPVAAEVTCVIFDMVANLLTCCGCLCLSLQLKWFVLLGLPVTKFRFVLSTVRD